MTRTIQRYRWASGRIQAIKDMNKAIASLLLGSGLVCAGLSLSVVSSRADNSLKPDVGSVPASTEQKTADEEVKLPVYQALDSISQRFGVSIHIEVLKKDTVDEKDFFSKTVVLPKGENTINSNLTAIQKQLPDITWQVDGKDASVVVPLSWTEKNPLDNLVGFDDEITVSYDKLIVWLVSHHPSLSVAPTMQWNAERPEFETKVKVKIEKGMTYRQVLENWFQSAKLNWNVVISTPLPRIEVREATTGRVLSVGKWPEGKSSLAAFSISPKGNADFEPQVASEFE